MRGRDGRNRERYKHKGVKDKRQEMQFCRVTFSKLGKGIILCLVCDNKVNMILFEMENVDGK